MTILIRACFLILAATLLAPFLIVGFVIGFVCIGIRLGYKSSKRWFLQDEPWNK